MCSSVLLFFLSNFMQLMLIITKPNSGVFSIWSDMKTQTIQNSNTSWIKHVDGASGCLLFCWMSAYWFSSSLPLFTSCDGSSPPPTVHTVNRAPVNLFSSEVFMESWRHQDDWQNHRPIRAVFLEVLYRPHGMNWPITSLPAGCRATLDVVFCALELFIVCIFYGDI